jgi:transcriptional regulator with XRE-family HTH domain
MAMTFTEYRKERGLTLDDAAAQLGYSSKGHISGIETGALRASLRLAFKIEAWSNGVISAVSLVSADDAALLAAHARLSNVADLPTVGR